MQSLEGVGVIAAAFPIWAASGLGCQRSAIIRQIIYLSLGYLVSGAGVNQIVLAGVRQG